MSAQYGRFNFNGRPVAPDDFSRVRSILVPYGPDGEGFLCQGNFGILYRAFCTTKESRREAQPYVNSRGLTVTWDGRLDNRDELINDLHKSLSSETTDVEIVAVAYETWGGECFRRLSGDWAVSIFDPAERTVLLVKDFLGTRHLYYSFENDEATWSTILDPFLAMGRKLRLDEEYLAGWLSFFPASQLTPFVGIHSVPPSCIVRLSKGKKALNEYWTFDPSRKIRYRSDFEYEEHFRSVFAQSVRRRLRSENPVLAELSGGMDSSSIVCMADLIISRDAADSRRLDTISYYDDSEPNWNERPYFGLVEEKRGRRGWHIDISTSAAWIPVADDESLAPVPGTVAGSNNTTDRFRECLSMHDNRVLLSGIGGDEVAGGVPIPTQELADLLSSFMFRDLAHKLKMWALAQRRPWFHILGETVRLFLPPRWIGYPESKRPPAWLNSNLASRYPQATTGYETRLKLFGALPSFQDSVATLNTLRRQLSCDHLSADPLYETRYPFLDRDLLEFLFAIPREQLVRPGQRRSLMRRSLIGIVPDKVLNRRRKAYVARSPLVALSREASLLIEGSDEMACTDFGFVDANTFSTVVQRAKAGQMVLIVPLRRALDLECWLRALLHRQLIDHPTCSVSSPAIAQRGQMTLTTPVQRDSAS